MVGVGGEKGVEESHQSQDHVSFCGNFDTSIDLCIWSFAKYESDTNHPEGPCSMLSRNLILLQFPWRQTFRCWFGSWGLIVVSSPKTMAVPCVFLCFVDLRHNTNLEVTLFKSSKRTDLERWIANSNRHNNQRLQVEHLNQHWTSIQWLSGTWP